MAFVLVLAIGWALGPSWTWAEKPLREFVPASDFSIPSGPCPFPVAFHVVVNQMYETTFYDPQGNPTRRASNGHLVIQITNQNSGASVVRNIGGPGVITIADNTLMAAGPWLFFFFPEELGPGTPGSMFINRGRLVEELGPPEQIDSQTGTQEDLCATLG